MLVTSTQNCFETLLDASRLIELVLKPVLIYTVLVVPQFLESDCTAVVLTYESVRSFLSSEWPIFDSEPSRITCELDACWAERP
jgi:hypothetical protein